MGVYNSHLQYLRSLADSGQAAWWLILYFVPLANIIVGVIVAMDVAKAFGQSPVFGLVLLFLLAGIGYLILGFGSARYVGPATGLQARAATAQP